MKKKLISSLLALIMVLSLVPISAFAENENDSGGTETMVDNSIQETIGTEVEVGNTLYYIEDGNLLSSVDSARPSTIDTDVVWVRERDGLIYYAKIDGNNTDIYKSGDGGFEKYVKLFCPIDAFDVEDGFLYYSYNGEVFKLDIESGKEETILINKSIGSFYLDEEGNVVAVNNSNEIGKSIINGSLMATTATANQLKDFDNVVINDENSGWYWPTNNNNTVVTSEFGDWKGRSGRLGGHSSPHQGIDIDDTNATDIFATRDGVVCEIGWEPNRETGRGQYVCIYHGKTSTGKYVVSTYMHMIEGSQKVKVGEKVFAKDTKLGTIGNTGASFGSHLHFQIERRSSVFSYSNHSNDNNLKNNYINTNPKEDQVSWNGHLSRLKTYNPDWAQFNIKYLFEKNTCANCAKAWTKSYKYHDRGYCDSCSTQYEMQTIDCTPFSPGVYKWNGVNKYGKKYVRNSPYDIKNNTVVTPDKYSEIQILGQVKNADGGRWYKIKVNGKEGYSVSYKIESDYSWKGNLPGDIRLQADSKGELKFPHGKMRKGSGFGLRGKIVSYGAEIKSVVGKIKRFDGTEIQNPTDWPYKTEYNIRYGVNNKLVFNNLPEGVYYVEYVATDTNGHSETFKSTDYGDYFTIGSVGIPPIITEENISGGKRVKLSCSNDSAQIYYSIDGGSSKKISNNSTFDIKKSGNYYIKAWTVTGGTTSDAVTKTVCISRANQPQIWNLFYPDGNKLLSVDIDVNYGDKCAYVVIQGEGNIYYTLDESTPTENSNRYTEQIPITESKTVKAISVMDGYSPSDVAEKEIIIKEPEPPVISPYNTKDKIAQGKTATVSWEPVKYATSYKASLFLNGECIDTYTTTGTKASFVLSKRSDTENFEYTIKVVATNFVGDSEFSNPVTVLGMHPVKVTFVDRIVRSGELTEDRLREVKRKLDNREGEGTSDKLENQVISVQKVDYDEYPSKPATPSKHGFTFSGWTSGLYEPAITDKTVYGEFEINYYNVRFWNYYYEGAEENKQIGDTQKIMYTDSATPPTEFEKPLGYVLAGWSVDNSASQCFDYTFVEGNMRLYTSYSWENIDLPTIIEITGVSRHTNCTSYSVNLRYTNNNLKDTQARIIVALYTSDNRMIYTQLKDIDMDKFKIGTSITDTVQLNYPNIISRVSAVMVRTENDITGGAVSEMTYSTDIEFPDASGYWDAWSGWSTTAYYASDTRQVEQKTQYRYRNKNYTTTNNTKSLSGWTYWYTDSSMGGWNYNGTNYVGTENSDYRKREVRTTWHDNYKTQWLYSRYVYNGKVQPYQSSSYTYYEDTGWHDYALPFEHYVTFANGGTYASYNPYWSQQAINDGIATRDRNWYNEQTRSVKSGGYNTYEYRDTYYTHHFWNWGGWSSWIDSYHSGDATETRTVYRYRDYKTNYPGYDPNRDSRLEEQTIKEYPISGEIKDVGTEYIPESQLTEKTEIVSGPYYKMDDGNYILTDESVEPVTKYRFGRYTNGSYTMPCKEEAEELYGGEWTLEWTDWMNGNTASVTENEFSCETAEHDHINYARIEEGIYYWDLYELNGESYCFMESFDTADEVKYQDTTKYYIVKKSLEGKCGTILVYKKTNSDPTQEQLEYVEQIRFGENNSYSFTVNAKEALDYMQTGDYIVTISAEGCKRLINVDVIKAKVPKYTVNFHTGDKDALRYRYYRYTNGTDIAPNAEDGEALFGGDWYIEYSDWYAENSATITERALNCTDSEHEHDDFAEEVDGTYYWNSYEIDGELYYCMETGDVLKTVVKEEGQSIDVNKIGIPQREGYRFVKWNKSVVDITEDLDVYAVWEPVKYAIVFVDHKNETTEMRELAYGDPIEGPEVEPVDGMIFKGWDNQSYKYVPETEKDNPAYTVVEGPYYLTTDGNYIPIERQDNEETDSRIKYYRVVRGELPVVTESMVITAVWEPIVYTVRFADLEGNTIETQEVSYGESATPPNCVTENGVTYSWDTNGATWWNVTSDMAVYPYKYVPSNILAPTADTAPGEYDSCQIVYLESQDKEPIYYSKGIEITQEDAKNYLTITSNKGIELFNAESTNEETEGDDYIRKYTEPIYIDYSTIIYAFTVKDGEISPISVYEYNINHTEEEEQYEIDPDCPQITLPSLTVKPGETVEVPVSIKNNPGLTNLSLVFGYDTDNLTLVSATNGDVFANTEYSADTREDGNCKFTWLSKSLNENDGTLLTLTFKAGDIAGKEKITMTIEEAIAPNEEESPFATQDGTVQNVGNNAYYGDINGDGSADFADAVMLIRYDIGLLTLTDQQKKFGDVNGDGEVDFADAIKIMRFDAGFISKLR